MPAVVTHTVGQSTGGNNSLVAATATVNISRESPGSDAPAVAAGGSGRVFLSHWDGTHDAFSHATAVVAVEVAGGPALVSAVATIHMIDNTSANLLWASWGSPAVLTAAQIAELKTYSEVVQHLIRGGPVTPK